MEKVNAKNRGAVFSVSIQMKAGEQFQLATLGTAGRNDSEAKSYIYEETHVESLDRSEKTIQIACIDMAISVTEAVPVIIFEPLQWMRCI